MAERANVNQKVQIAPETTGGTYVPATKSLQSLNIKPGFKLETHTYDVEGQKYPSLVVPTKEWTEASYDGPLTYSETLYALAGAIVKPVGVKNGVNASYVWNVVPDSFAPDTVTSFSVEQGTPGSAAFGQHFSYGTFTAFNAKLDRSSTTISGTIIGQRMVTAAAITVATTPVELQPVIPTQVTPFIDPTFAAAAGLPDAAFGGTTVLRMISLDFGIDNRFGPLWVLNATNPSWVVPIELKPKVTGKFLVEADAYAVDPTTGIVAQWRAGTTKYLTLQAIGATIGVTPQKYAFIFQCPYKINNVSPYEDHEGVYALTFDFSAVHDVTFNKIGTSAATTITNAASGGTIAIGTYNATQTVVTPAGESLAAANVNTTTTTGVSTITITPVPVVGAASYNLYYKLSTDTNYQKVSTTGAPVVITSYVAGATTLPVADTTGGGAYLFCLQNAVATL